MEWDVSLVTQLCKIVSSIVLPDSITFSLLCSDTAGGQIGESYRKGIEDSFQPMVS